MEPLLDPVSDRFMKDITPPPHLPISEELLYPNPCTYFSYISLYRIVHS